MKAILELSAPRSCFSCPLRRDIPAFSKSGNLAGFVARCGVVADDEGALRGVEAHAKGRSSFCPLKSVPVEQRETTYKFVEEVAVIFPDCDGVIMLDDEDNERELVSSCVIQCSSCGWHMFGDGWYEAANSAREMGEQIPRYCAHCGKKFMDEEVAV